MNAKKSALSYSDKRHNRSEEYYVQLLLSWETHLQPWQNNQVQNLKTLCIKSFLLRIVIYV